MLPIVVPVHLPPPGGSNVWGTTFTAEETGYSPHVHMSPVRTVDSFHRSVP